jgi:hypothetical protein
MVTVLAIRPKAGELKLDRRDRDLKGRSTIILHGSISQKTTLNQIKIRCTPSFGGKEKPETPCRKTLRHFKDHLQVRKIPYKDKFIIPFARSSCLLPDDSNGSICQRALADESIFLRRHHSTMVLHAHISPVESTISPLVAAVQRCSLTPSTWTSL